MASSAGTMPRQKLVIGYEVCKQLDKNEDKAKMDKIMVLIMLEKF